MKISIITLFPEMFSGPFDHSIVKKAIEKKFLRINFVNLRDFGIGKHKTVDDRPFGGGHGMILRADVIEKAIQETVDKKLSKNQQKIVLLGPRGKQFTSKKAESFAGLKHLILICGHYEGIDERIKYFIDEEISVGDFILTGGEIPAMLISDAVTRHVKNVLKKGVVKSESFSPYLEHPHYTQPRKFKKYSVPEILLSGNHAEINRWKNNESLKLTKKLRPDLVRKD